MTVRLSHLEEHIETLVSPALQNAIAGWRSRERDRLLNRMADLVSGGDPGAAEVGRQLRELDEQPWGVEQMHIDPGNDASRALMEFLVLDPHLRGRLRVRVLYDARGGIEVTDGPTPRQ